MRLVTGIGANRDPDAGAECLDQLTQQYRVAVVKPLDIDWISDRSNAFAAVGCCGFCTPPGAHCARSAPALKIVQRTAVKGMPELEVTTTAGYH